MFKTQTRLTTFGCSVVCSQNVSMARNDIFFLQESCFYILSDWECNCTTMCLQLCYELKTRGRIELLLRKECSLRWKRCKLDTVQYDVDYPWRTCSRTSYSMVQKLELSFDISPYNLFNTLMYHMFGYRITQTILTTKLVGRFRTFELQSRDLSPLTWNGAAISEGAEMPMVRLLLAGRKIPSIYKK